MPATPSLATAIGKFPWLKSLKPTRESVVFAAILAAVFHASYILAFLIRGELLFNPSDAKAINATIGLVVAMKVMFFYMRGFCHRPWRAARFQDLNSLIRAATACMLLLIAYNYFGQYLMPGRIPVPRAVLLLDWAFTVLGVGGMQALARSVHEELAPVTAVGKPVVLVIDADAQSRELATEISGTCFIAGFLDDDPDHYGAHFNRARVLGPVSQATACAERLRVTDVVVRQGAIYGDRLRGLCDACGVINVRVSIAEQSTSAESSAKTRAVPFKATRFQLRQVELRDLLARPQANLADKDAHVLPFLVGKSVLVTGAGGSIGSEICRQVMRFRPKRLVLVERSEYALFSIQQDLQRRQQGATTEVITALLDVTNLDRMDRLLAEHRPEVIVHAAAFKHVPLMEGHPIDAVENNTLATAGLAELADAHGTEAFVALSTDKAVHPSSVMGASKLVAERFLQSFGQTSRTRFVTVRFGNVLGSSGSAVPIFEEQLSRGLPITITHPDVRRYFMTIDEAAQLVLFAGSLEGRGGTFVLEMGESLRMVEVVQSLAFLMNVPRTQVQIKYCGLRPGEKLDEQLFFEDEAREVTANPLVTRVARQARSLDEVRGWLAELKSAAAAGDTQVAAASLLGIVLNDCGTAAEKPGVETTEPARSYGSADDREHAPEAAGSRIARLA
ncbi:MAG: polysaccharide biosynthesis protein [Planctomycetaceae bacterium]